MTYLNFPKELQCARWVSGMLKEFRSAHDSRKLAVTGLLLNPPVAMSTEMLQLLHQLDLKDEGQ
eukprot:11675068-Prorocentrum_lima.AAC.1